MTEFLPMVQSISQFRWSSTQIIMLIFTSPSESACTSCHFFVPKFSSPCCCVVPVISSFPNREKVSWLCPSISAPLTRICVIHFTAFHFYMDQNKWCWWSMLHLKSLFGARPTPSVPNIGAAQLWLIHVLEGWRELARKFSLIAPSRLLPPLLLLLLPVARSALPTAAAAARRTSNQSAALAMSSLALSVSWFRLLMQTMPAEEEEEKALLCFCSAARSLSAGISRFCCLLIPP